jgi:hypothetical protein
MVDPNESLDREPEAEQQPAPAAPPEPELKARWRWQPGQQLEREVGTLATRTEACVELYHSHALDRVAGLLQSFNEGFTHVMFDRTQSETTLCDEYENAVFHVEYRLCEEQRDQLRVSWAAQAADPRHSDAELLALARQIADQLGGGTNLRLIEVPTE